jgi:hypothetical protein
LILATPARVTRLVTITPARFAVAGGREPATFKEVLIMPPFSLATNQINFKRMGAAQGRAAPIKEMKLICEKRRKARSYLKGFPFKP